ncbi:hypothetical protein RT42_GL000463 [Enterococcus cecorum DSM 20682 = ATCC 43198]|nr:hypothetical protein RT42_GL000463 [Enterococcus cecorum DSM 20682 = ATCC 43198]
MKILQTTDDVVFNNVIVSSEGAEFLIASPLCQVMSIARKN